jgi:hypothetical protein
MMNGETYGFLSEKYRDQDVWRKLRRRFEALREYPGARFMLDAMEAFERLVHDRLK